MKPARPGEQALWEDAHRDWWWLDRYQLTPAQVDEIPAPSYTRIPQIAALADEIRQEQHEQAARGR